MKVVNLFAGPGTGKSTTCAGLFSELKHRAVNCELVTEYAKDLTWERRGPKVFEAQEYIFGKQHFKMSRLIREVDIMITDSPILLCAVYTPENYRLPSLQQVIFEAHNLYDNLNIFLHRSPAKTYNPAGRNQSMEEAGAVDRKIIRLLQTSGVPFTEMTFARSNVDTIMGLMKARGWFDAQ